ncbi:MAG: CDP-alcohol phosphatidyltransferase family protein [Chromatiales bacterium]|nr:CDP-alcohol phosphatidyltransferase family protein [Chromatiales bacterium]
MKAHDLPNYITFGRLLLVGPVVWCLLNQYYSGALALFALAGVSDALDGFLAKRYGWQSRLGTVLDPLADKVLLVSAYIALGVLGWLPIWLVTAVIVRDVVIVIGAVSYYFRIAAVDMTPLAVSKLNTFTQIVLVLAVVAHAGFGIIAPIWLERGIWIVAATTIVSGVSYVLIWGYRALSAVRAGTDDGRR